MDDIYQLEAENIEKIKVFFRHQGKKIMIFLITLAVIGGGVLYSNYHQKKTTEKASALYDLLLDGVKADDFTTVETYAAQLKTRYVNTPYASLAGLLLAKEYVKQRDYPKAIESLELAKQKSKEAFIRHLATTRLAKLYFANKQSKKAHEVLDVKVEKAFQPLYDRMKGDIFLLEKKFPEALEAYEKVLLVAQGEHRRFLEMTINDLKARTFNANQ